jgi:hypothetical protein
MEHLNRRGQVLIESVFVILCLGSLLILFQLMIDNQRKETSAHRLSQTKKDIQHVPENENFETK